ncbi:MAG: hypothetical protein R3F43_27135 [bacterium]
MYFPHKGILGQSAEAKNKRINATIGVALEEDGRPLVLGCVAEQVGSPRRAGCSYAGFGKPTLRQRWASMIGQEPGLAEEAA